MESDDIEVHAQPIQLGLAGVSFYGYFLIYFLLELCVMLHKTAFLIVLSIYTL